MSETIGRIELPDAIIDTSTPYFPFVTEYPHGMAIARQVIAHSFGDPRVEQRYFVGDPAARYTYVATALTNDDRATLVAFWQSIQGGVLPFIYGVPQEDQSFVETVVRFENGPLTLNDLLACICSVGITFIEIPDPAIAPEYATDTNSPLIRFPDTTLAEALLDEVQEIIPLIHIRVAEAAVDDIYLSDRRVTIDGTLYQPRLLRVGDPGSDILIQQSIDGSTDDVQFAFGNADRLMIQLANDTELKWAQIELSLYHVQTGYLLNLWAGRIVSWESNAGPEFVIHASDPLSALNILSPVRVCSHSCYRRYGLDGCPAIVGSQPLDTAHFPLADATWCDLGYDTPNGCLAHSPAGETKHYFGGVVIAPEQAQVLDNSTGLWGLGRQSITPTSQINDSAWGKSLPEIWHNDDGIPQRGLPVQCTIACGREESDFYSAIGLVGVGPIGAFTTTAMVDTDGDGTKETFVGSTLDGQPHHGWKVDSSGNPTGNSYGLFTALGTDPAGANDYFSIGRVAGTPDSFREVISGSSVFWDNFISGISFLSIRRVDEVGVQLSTPGSHSMIAMISQGLTGWTWTDISTRTAVPGCTNLFWVAINTYLRAIGANSLTDIEQSAYLDVDAAITCATTADTIVAKIIGTGTEAQFRFKGTIDSSKATRDWVRDILNNGLGFFTWSFGRLRLGLRINAAPITTFHAGNMLFGSLKLQPITPEFEKLVIEFADEEYLFAKNTVDYTDQDHAARYSRIQNPLTSQFGLVGCSTKSQAARVATVRTREELGGVGESEQKRARLASWRSTIMALDCEAGMVVDLVDDDLPDGYGTMRIQTIRVNRDWSVDFMGKTVTDSMYDLTQGNVPAAVSSSTQPTPAVLPGQFSPDLEWAANNVPVSTDQTSYVDGVALDMSTLGQLVDGL
jgi:hypothetical protein